MDAKASPLNVEEDAEKAQGAAEKKDEDEHEEATVEKLLSRLQVDSDDKLDVNVLVTDIHNLYQTFINNMESPQVSSDSSSSTNANSVSYADPKSNELSRRFRDMATTLLKNDEKLDEALILYTQGVAAAGSDSAELAAAYADRSYGLFRMGNYRSCVLDVNRALKDKFCPESLTKKLRERKKQCIVQNRAEGDADRFNSDAIEASEFELSGMTMDHSKWSNFCHFDPPNAFLPNSSPWIRLECNEEWGRHMVATKDIEPGEILSIENFYVMELNRDKRFTHCSFCLLKCDALIPCNSCTRTMYCSYSCRLTAFNSYHRVECKMIAFYERDKADWRETMALQTFLVGTEQGNQLPALMKKLKPKDIFAENDDPRERLFVSNYLSALKMCRTFDNVSLIKKAMLPAVQATVALIRSSFFGPNDILPERLGKSELFTTLLMLNHLISVGSNDFRILSIVEKSVSIVEKSVSPVQTLLKTPAGQGVFILQNLINHSCNPNTNSFIQDRQRFLFATRPIKSGEQIFYAFRHMYPYEPLEKRSARLLKYPGFNCKCEACVGNWPSIAVLKNRGIRFSTPNPQTPITGLNSKMHVMRRGRSLEELEGNDLLQIIIEHLKMLYDIMETPSFEILVCEELLSRFMKVFYCEHHRDYINFIQQKNYLEVTLTMIMKRVFQALP